MTFYLGTHKPQWLARTAVPLMVSRRRLAERKALPRALGPWLLDSGGFTELSLFGRWETPAAQYVAEVKRFAVEIGQLVGAACQDWMCEPAMLQRTGLTVAEHQRRTVASFRTLAAEGLPVFPVLQGWEPRDYLRHVEAYVAAGVDLWRMPLVGVGSVCRRQHTGSLLDVLEALAQTGLANLHGFGVKRQGLVEAADLLASADSMAWSLDARYSEPLSGCTHASCANCLRYALRWAQGVAEIGRRPKQLRLW